MTRPAWLPAPSSLLRDDDARARLARAGSELVRGRFDWDNTAAVLERQLEAYVANPNSYQRAPADGFVARGRTVTSPEPAFVFNVVWTGSVFPYLRHFVASQLRHSGARFRFVANGCPPDQVRLMERFAAAEHGRVIEVFVSSTTMERHGAALDAVLEARDDGEFFCFVDPDILAERPYLPEFADALDEGCAAVTSGRGVWTDDVIVPAGHPGVPGECFYSQDGYLFGSPHFAMYRRAPLQETISRWGAGFGSAGADLTQDAKDAMAAAGHRYWIYDTGKIVNILLQEDGHRLCHFEHPALLHIGGMSHYLSPPDGRRRAASRRRGLGPGAALARGAARGGALHGHPAPGAVRWRAPARAPVRARHGPGRAPRPGARRGHRTVSYRRRRRRCR